jgi:hypothetical protein
MVVEPLSVRGEYLDLWNNSPCARAVSTGIAPVPDADTGLGNHSILVKPHIH